MIRTPNCSQFLLSTTGAKPFAGASPRSRRPSMPIVTVKAFAGEATMNPAMKKAIGSNLYEVLQIKQTASAVEIKSAYRSLAKMFHPDVARSESSDGPRFIEIHNAYATLSDPMARARYDDSIGVRVRGRLLRYESVESRRWRRWETDQCW